MKHFSIITVGKVKTEFWRIAVEHYRARLTRGCKIQETVVRDADVNAGIEQKKEQEGERILAALPSGHTYICLDEHGKGMTSIDFADCLEGLENRSAPACFIIGGAYGLSEKVLQRCNLKVSFGQMTFPHELAQVMLWEQIFRADAIKRKTGYHHI